MWPIFFQDGENFTVQQSSIMASLALIGGFDSRARLGGTIVTEAGLRGVVSKIGVHGKLVVQLHDTNDVKKIPLTVVHPSIEQVSQLR